MTSSLSGSLADVWTELEAGATGCVCAPGSHEDLQKKKSRAPSLFWLTGVKTWLGPLTATLLLKSSEKLANLNAQGGVSAHFQRDQKENVVLRSEKNVIVKKKTGSFCCVSLSRSNERKILAEQRVWCCRPIFPPASSNVTRASSKWAAKMSSSEKKSVCLKNE